MVDQTPKPESLSVQNPSQDEIDAFIRGHRSLGPIALVSERKMTPEAAAEILIRQRSYRHRVESKSLVGKLGFLVVALVASFFGVRQDRA